MYYIGAFVLLVSDLLEFKEDFPNSSMFPMALHRCTAANS